MKKIIIILILFVILSVVGIYFAKSQNVSIPDFNFHLSSGESAPFKPIFSSNKKEYKNITFGFSLKMPDDFLARELETDESALVIIENNEGAGIQVAISPFDDLKVLTKEMIQKDLPDLKISNPESVDIGYDYKGLAFKSDNPAFSGASSEIWFIFRGHLYQMSTYEKSDALIKDIFASWKF